MLDRFLVRNNSFLHNLTSCIDHYQNEREAGSESLPQLRLGGTGFNRSIKHEKMPRQYNWCVPGCANSHNCSGAAYLLVLSLKAIPSTFALLIPTQVPTRFGNGQFRLFLFVGTVQVRLEAFLKIVAMRVFRYYRGNLNSKKR